MKGGQAASSWPTMAALHQQLHQAAVQLAGTGGAMASMMVPRICAASTAAGLLMHMCGDIQAFRRLLCELLLECKVRPELALPAYAAASDAWPSGLPPATASDAASLWSAASDTGGHDHSTCGVALLHSIAYKLSHSHSMHSRAEGAEDREEGAAVADLAVLCLRHLGRSHWNWHALDPLQCVKEMPADCISDGESWTLLAALLRGAKTV